MLARVLKQEVNKPIETCERVTKAHDIEPPHIHRFDRVFYAPRRYHLLIYNGHESMVDPNETTRFYKAIAAIDTVN